MYFVFLVALATALLLILFVRKKAEQKGAVKRISIAVTEGVALVTLPAAYEVEDMCVLWEFIQGKDAAKNRARLQGLLYDCSEWRWSNVLGLEMVLWQVEEWTGDTIFCQLSPEMKAVLDLLLERVNVPQKVMGNPLPFRPVLYFATVKEGLAYARARKGGNAV